MADPISFNEKETVALSNNIDIGQKCLDALNHKIFKTS